MERNFIKVEIIKNCTFSATFLQSILLKIDGETKGVPISVNPHKQQGEDDAERQTSTSFLEKLGDMRPDGEENQAK